MVIVVLLSIISFVLEGFISNYQNYTILNPTIFSTIYILITLIIVSKYFNNEKKYMLIIVIFGLLYDICYTNTFVLNAILFLIICLLCNSISKILSDTIINTNIITLIGVILYHVLSFSFLTIVNYGGYSPKLLLIITTHSIIMTIIYTTITYYLSDYLYKKFEVKPIR